VFNYQLPDMETISLQKIHESNKSIIYKAKNLNDDKNVIVKVLNYEFPTKEQITRFNNEYEFTEELIIPGVRKVLKKDKKDGKNCLILEYIDGQTLKDFISTNNCDIKSLIEIASKISQTLGEIHLQNIIHKDINSNNILINEKHEIKIIDFGLATKYTLKTQSLSNPEHLEGTLAYISPEQTGRMNRSVDYRSDLYSLGIVLYEMFTKQLPFTEKDNMELIHSHIAKTPIPANEINDEISNILSNIILKLLSKNAEDRYQSAFGLKHDLANLSGLQDLTGFRIGEKDFSGRLTIPEKLYGREEEIKQLYEIYENICQGQTELLLVEGLPGVGKSALIQEIHKLLSEKKGFYIEGKFDQFQKDIPYYAIINAFTDFANLILKESDDKLNYWKNLIQEAVSNIGRVLTNLIPDLELIIGKQPELPILEGKEAQNRFNYVWGNFVKAISTAKHPLIIFIDDLQWADNSSVELLKNLLSDNEIQYLFCIIAYRDNETDISDLQVFESVENLKINKIQLQNLKQNDVNNLVSDTLIAKNLTGLVDLSGLIYSKTLGNAFFTLQFLKNLYEEEFLKFDFKENLWTWNFEEIEKQNITDNVVELMAKKVRKLPKETQEVLKIAACIGNRFDLKILSIIYKQDDEIAKKDLEAAIFENLILPLDKQNFRFVHDRIQQAVYSTIPDQEKTDFHQQTGKLLLEFFDKEKLQEHILEVVNQLNYGKNLIENKEEKLELAELNYKAGIKAKQSSAYLPAYNYLKISSDLLEKDSWETDYQFTLKIYDEIAELSYLSIDYDKTEEYVKLIKEKANDFLHTINAYFTLVNSYRAQLKLKKAVETAIKLLSLLGLKMPIYPGKFYIIKELIKTQIAIGKKQTKDFAKLPLMTDKKQLAKVKLISSIASSVLYVSPKLFPVLVFKSSQIILKYGNCTLSPIFYIGWGLVLVSMKKYDKAVEFGELAKDIIPSLNARQHSARTNYYFTSFIKVWKKPFRIVAPEIYNAHKSASEIGDFEVAGYAALNLVLHLYLDMPLQQLKNKMILKFEPLKKLNQQYSSVFSLLLIEICDNLISIKENQCTIKGDYFDEELEIPRDVINNPEYVFLSYFYLYKLLLHIVFNDLQNAKTYLEILEKRNKDIEFFYYFALNNFYSSLIYLQHYENEKNNIYLKKVNKNQKSMKIWVKHCPENFQNKYDLVEAEKFRVLNKTGLAENFYNKAIYRANKNQFLNEEAISWELAARFYIQQKNSTLAKSYMQNAYNCYKRWGALAKLKQMKDKYPQFIFTGEKTISSSGSAVSTTISSSTTESSSLLDLTSIVKASQSLSGEVKLENLLKNMLRIIMENAGAEYAVIIKNDEGIYTIEAKGRHGSDKIEVLQSENIEKTEAVALNVVNYVIRTRKFLVVDNALTDKQYSNNEYIQKNKVKSVFCFPVVHKNKLLAILYLENNLSTHVFTSQRIETINILSSQIAISIENALLYGNLEDKVTERTTQLQKAKEEIEDAHKGITDSINYASRIQNAILPTARLFEDNFSNYFILFKPRDVVSGDFYWAKKVNEHLVIAAADCTGHGVPGAFVSMLGISFLNEIAGKKEAKTASHILEELRVQIKTSLHQTGDSNEAKDGMDIALCVINLETYLLQFAGAYNPLYIIRNKEFIEIKATRNPIGIYLKEKPFKNNEIQLQKNDMLFMFSDGYADQFGGKKATKFKSKNFKELLLLVSDKSVSEQKQILNNTFEEWRGNIEQVDDVLVVGLKI